MRSAIKSNPKASSQKRQRGRKKEIPYPLKLVLMGGAVVLCSYLLVLLVVKVAIPFRLGSQVNGEIRRVRADLAKQKHENARLKSRIALSKSNEGAERAARESGFAKPNEQVFLFPQEMKSALPTMIPATPTPQNVKPRAR